MMLNKPATCNSIIHSHAFDFKSCEFNPCQHFLSCICIQGRRPQFDFDVVVCTICCQGVLLVAKEFIDIVKKSSCSRLLFVLCG